MRAPADSTTRAPAAHRARTFYDFFEVKVIGYLPSRDEEKIEFGRGKYNIFAISKVEVCFD